MKLLTRIFTMIFIFIVAFSVNGGADTVKMDKEVPNFTLKDAMDKEHSLKDLSHEKKATVVMFISTQCPVSNHYNERIVALHNDYKDQGVQFIGINSNKNESVEEIAEHNKTSKFDCVVLKDLRNEIADKFGARRTPEVYLLDEKRRLGIVVPLIIARRTMKRTIYAKRLISWLPEKKSLKTAKKQRRLAVLSNVLGKSRIEAVRRKY